MEKLNKETHPSMKSGEGKTKIESIPFSQSYLKEIEHISEIAFAAEETYRKQVEKELKAYRRWLSEEWLPDVSDNSVKQFVVDSCMKLKETELQANLKQVIKRRVVEIMARVMMEFIIGQRESGWDDEMIAKHYERRKKAIEEFDWMSDCRWLAKLPDIIIEATRKMES